MLSLGTEVETRHKHGIDNLYMDGNGCLVVAELKRGEAKREVIAQILDYAAHISRLELDDIDALCQIYRSQNLEVAFQECFGRPLAKSEKIDHRLLVMAEGYDPSAEDAAAYLINTGVDLTLLAFRYFELNGERLLDVSVVLGEIPEQTVARGRSITAGETSEMDGYRNWLSRTLRDELPRFAESRGVSVNLGRGERYLSFIPEPWPYPLGDCRFSIGINSRNIGIYFSYLNERVSGDLYEVVARKVSEESNPYDPERLSVAEQWTTLSHAAPLPELGSKDQVNFVIKEAFRMVDTIIPVVHSLEETAP